MVRIEGAVRGLQAAASRVESPWQRHPAVLVLAQYYDLVLLARWRPSGRRWLDNASCHYWQLAVGRRWTIFVKKLTAVPNQTLRGIRLIVAITLYSLYVVCPDLRESLGGSSLFSAVEGRDTPSALCQIYSLERLPRVGERSP